MTHITLELASLEPHTLAMIVANLSRNLNDEDLAIVAHVDSEATRMMNACIAQLDALVGTEEEIELLVKYDAEPEVIMATA